MNVTIDRDLLAQFAIVMAIAIGGWLTFADAGAREVARLEAELEQHKEQQSSQIGVATTAELNERLVVLRARTARIVRCNELGEDSTRLYSTVRDLAESHGIILRRLQPGLGRAKPGKAVATSKLEMSFECGVPELAAFIDAVEAIEGFVRPESLTLTPLAEGRVTARYVVSVLHFPLEDVLVQMEGRADAGS